MLETSGIGKNEKVLLHRLFPFYPKIKLIKSIIYDVYLQNCQVCPVWCIILKKRATLVHQTLTVYIKALSLIA